MPAIVSVASLGTGEINQCGNVLLIVPVAAIYSGGIVGWRISYRHYMEGPVLC